MRLKMRNRYTKFEKAIEMGDVNKVRYLLDCGYDLPEQTFSFLSLLQSDTVSIDQKISVCKLFLRGGRRNIPTNEIVFTACVLGYEDIIDTWKFRKEEDEFLILDLNHKLPNGYIAAYHNHQYYDTFSRLSEEECINALHRILDCVDPKKKQEFLLHEADGIALYQPNVIKFIFDHFIINEHFGYGNVIKKTVSYKQVSTLRFLAETWKDKAPEEIIHKYDLRDIVVDSITQNTPEILKLIFDAGWAKPVYQNENIKSISYWEGTVILEALKSDNPEHLEILFDNILPQKVPSSVKKEALRQAVITDNSHALDIFGKQKWIKTPAMRDSLIELASEHMKVNALSWLLEYKNKTTNPDREAKLRERRELRALS